MTDFRALCAELADAYAWCVDNYMTGSSRDDSLVQRARTALAEGDGVGVSDDVAQLVDKCIATYAEDPDIIVSGSYMLIDDGKARATLLERLTSPRPVPVAERLPEP
jgi:hypothetical protein